MNKKLIMDVKDLLVDIWVKNILITLGFFLLVFSMWIPVIVYEAVTASLLSLALSPIIKEKTSRVLKHL